MALAAGAAVAAAPQLWSAETKGEIPLRPLGQTGEKVSAIGLGGYHIGIQSDEQLSLTLFVARLIAESRSWTTAGIITTG